MLQTAAAAESASGVPSIVAAALHHDVGHFITDFAKIQDDSKHLANPDDFPIAVRQQFPLSRNMFSKSL